MNYKAEIEKLILDNYQHPSATNPEWWRALFTKLLKDRPCFKYATRYVSAGYNDLGALTNAAASATFKHRNPCYTHLYETPIYVRCESTAAMLKRLQAIADELRNSCATHASIDTVDDCPSIVGYAAQEQPPFTLPNLDWVYSSLTQADARAARNALYNANDKLTDQNFATLSKLPPQVVARAIELAVEEAKSQDI